MKKKACAEDVILFSNALTVRRFKCGLNVQILFSFSCNLERENWLFLRATCTQHHDLRQRVWRRYTQITWCNDILLEKKQRFTKSYRAAVCDLSAYIGDISGTLTNDIIMYRLCIDLYIVWIIYSIFEWAFICVFRLFKFELNFFMCFCQFGLFLHILDIRILLHSRGIDFCAFIQKITFCYKTSLILPVQMIFQS